ncbi:DNA damage-inducible protein D [Nonlabens sp.]|uniref:DNA damage-inducible protein D n=1 Tax=Nonlabens sp. TaxID=1888209 RepID=UPI001BCEA9EB|nr:DNA damage-inducible protein D [Nonlabens sp.]
MKSDIIKSLTNNFETNSHTTEEGIEFWLARDLQHLLDYSKWDNFQSVISKAKTACELSGEDVLDHFADVGKMVVIGSNTEKEIPDIMLTRFACYLIAQNGDSRKEKISFAQRYFAVQTRKAELIEQRMLEFERVQAREKLKQTEKELSQVISDQTGGNQNFALIRSKGDQALFGRSTQQMKQKWQIKSKPLADFMPAILLKAKDFATEITIFNAKENQMKSEGEISKEHITNNTSVRNTLLSRGIVPENLPPEEDVNKVDRKLKSDERKITRNPDKLK